MRLVFSPEADEDVDRVDTWWRENRLDAPRLFAEELAYTRDQILRNPLIYKPYCARNGVIVRRWLMRRTEQHVYYEVDLEHDCTHPASCHPRNADEMGQQGKRQDLCSSR